MMAEKKVGWWKRPFALILDSDWDLDPYKVAGFVLLWQFCEVVTTTMRLIEDEGDVALIGVGAGLLLPITTMATFMFNYSKEHDKKLLDAAKE